MAQVQQEIQVGFREIVELTNGDTDAITFQVLDGRIQIIRATNARPAAIVGWEYRQGQGERNTQLSDISTADGSRVWAVGMASSGSEVIVDHA